jgi:hypothetical protein
LTPASWILQLYPTVFSHEGGHYDEASAQGGDPHLNWTAFVPTSTSYGGSPNALADARGINQNWLNAREIWSTLKLSDKKITWADRGGLYANQAYMLYYTILRTKLGVGPQGDNDIKGYANATGASIGGLVAASVTTTALNLGSDIFASRIEGLLGNKVMAPRFEALLTLSGETLFGIQTIVKPSWCWPSIEVNLNSTLSFSQFSLEAKAHDLFKFQLFSHPSSVSISGAFGRTESNWAGSIGADFRYELSKGLGVGASIGYRGDGNPVHQVVGKEPGAYGAANVQVSF